MHKAASFFQRCAAIKKIPIFASVDVFRLHRIAGCGDVVHYKKGELVSRKANPPDFVFFVISGRLISYNLDSDGKKDDVEFIHRGMFFGIISALTGETHSQNFEAINDSIVFQIPVARFRNLLKKSPDLSLKFSKALSQRIRNKVTKTEFVSRSKIISVFSPTSGSGSSTYAFSLALSFYQETGDRVIWITITSRRPVEHPVESDLDEIRPKWRKEPEDLVTVTEDLENISRRIVHSNVGIDIINVSFDPASHQGLVQNISDFVGSFLDDYRYIIVDLPSELDDVVMKTFTQSDIIHLILMRQREALETARETLDHIETYLKDTFTEDRVRVIVGGAHSHRNLADEEVAALLDYNVLAFLPHIQRKDLAMEIDSPALHFWAINTSSQYWAMITRLSRQISGVSVGLVLGGGAAFGLAHIGVIRVLEEENIPIDVVVGSSMGALIGGLWAAGFNADELEKMAYEFRVRSNLFKLIDLVFPLSGLISGKAVTSWLRSKFHQKTFKDLKIPLKVVAYDLIHRKDLIIVEGLLVDAVRKSISIPGVFQPIVNDDQLIIDGGVMNPLPTNVLTSSDVKKIIAVNVLQSPEDVIRGYEMTRLELNKSLAEPFLKDPWFFIDIRFRFWLNKVFFPNISDIIVRTLEASECVIAEQSARGADIVIHPDLSGLNWYELYQADILIKRGEEAARLQLGKIKEMMQLKKQGLPNA
ncbi:MAG: patatin-like phospholipase family protein [Candidatus Omnitrophica bacterium]|nr:patatin-like phospholipase family protein [Candidatus Omnitrophota bacterium]